MNDCKYGYKIYENILDLNLLRSPTEPDPIADQGHHEFTYSLFPHVGTLIQSDVLKEASMLNIKPMIFENKSSDKKFTPVILQGDGLSLEVVKRAEKDDSIIIRVVETKGCYSTGTVELVDKSAKIAETDMMEWNDKQVITSNEPIAIKLKPFEIRTYRIFK